MPRKAINYSNSCVYKICCNDINITDCYVGSTTNLNKRKRQHKSRCNTENRKDYNFNVYKFIRDNGGWRNWTVVLVESYPECKSREELLRFERYHMEKLEATLNSQVPGRTKKQWGEDNSDKMKEYYKEYYQDNVEKIKECRKEYRQDNAEKIKEKGKEKIECEFCHSVVRKNGLPRHHKSKKCLATR